MTPTVTYGVWQDFAGEPTVEQSILDRFGDYMDNRDVNVVAEKFREMLNEALPEWITFTENRFTGQSHLSSTTWASGHNGADPKEMISRALLKVGPQELWQVVDEQNIGVKQDA